MAAPPSAPAPEPEPPAPGGGWPGGRRHGRGGRGTTYVSGSWAFGPGRGVPWVGVLLVLFGLALLLQQLGSPIGADGLVLAALALAFLYAWLLGGERWAVLPAGFFVALAIAQILEDLGIIAGSGWTALFLGVAFLLVWLIGRAGGPGVGRDWVAWVGVIFLIVAGIQLSERLTGIGGIGDLWPLIIVAAGIWLILREFQRPRHL